MENKRSTERIDTPLVTYIRTPQGKGYVINQFLTKNISENGLFICSDNLSLFTLGDELEIWVDDNEQKYYEGKAKIVRSAKVFTEDDEPIESGYGLFLESISEEYSDLIRNLNAQGE